MSEHGGVTGLQVSTVEQQHHAGRAGLPVLAPGLDRGELIGSGFMPRVKDGCGRQGLWCWRLQGQREEACADVAVEAARVGCATFAQIAPQGPAAVDVHRAFHQQIAVFKGVAGKHDEGNAARAAQHADAFGAVGPVTLAAEVVDDDDAGVLQHFIDVQVDRGRLTQIHQVGQTHRRKAVRVAACSRAGSGKQGQRGVGGAEDDDVGRVLRHARDDAAVIDEATGLGGEQVHQRAPLGAARAAASIAAGARAARKVSAHSSWPISTRWVRGVSSARQRRSK